MTATSLLTFPVTGDWSSQDEPRPGDASTDIIRGIVYGHVLFTPRLPHGFVAYVDQFDLSPAGDGSVKRPTAVSVTPLGAHIHGGRLCSQVTGFPPVIELVSNDPRLALSSNPDVMDGELIYDVKFYDTTFSGVVYEIENFAFSAPVDATAVVLTSPTLPRLKYNG
jgi:hypothetical protein